MKKRIKDIDFEINEKEQLEDGEKYEITEIGNLAFRSYNVDKDSQFTSFKIPATVKILGNSCFGDCTAVNSITFEGDISRIGSQAFFNCTGIAEINIPGNVDFIDSQAFYGWKSTQIINFEMESEPATGWSVNWDSSYSGPLNINWGIEM